MSVGEMVAPREPVRPDPVIGGGAHARDQRWLRRLRRRASVGANVTVTGPVLIRGRGEVVIGDGVVLDAAQAPIELAAHQGRLELGPGCYLGPGTSVEALERVVLGEGVLVGPYAKILDNSYHGTGEDRSVLPASTPIEIGSHAVVGARSVLLPGAAMGPGSVLADDGVLAGRLPAGVVAGGVPARRVDPALHEAERLRLPRWLPGSGEPVGPFREVAADTPAVGPAMLAWLSDVALVESRVGSGPPRALLAKARRALAWANGRRQLRSATTEGRVFSSGSVRADVRGELHLGSGCCLVGGPLASRLEVGPGARLSIGPDAVLNYGVVLRADVEVRAGARLMMGSRTVVVDRHDGRCEPVVMGDDVWLAHGVTVLPGVTIGDGSAVSAGTVVDRDVPARSLASGSPMRIRPLTVARRTS